MTDRLPVAAEGALPDAPTAATPAAATGDPFPRERFVSLLGRLPRYLRLAWGLAGEPRLPAVRRAGVLAAAAYLVSPVDVIPGVIPIIGQVDDIAIALLALRAALRALDPATRERQLAAAGLAVDDLDRDLGTLVVTGAWLARRGASIGRHVGLLAATAAVAAGRAGVQVVRLGAPVAARAGGRAARTTAGAMRDGAPAAARAGSRAARAAGSALVRPARSAAGWARTRGRGLDADAERDAGSGI